MLRRRIPAPTSSGFYGTLTVDGDQVAAMSPDLTGTLNLTIDGGPSYNGSIAASDTMYSASGLLTFFTGSAIVPYGLAYYQLTFDPTIFYGYFPDFEEGVLEEIEYYENGSGLFPALDVDFDYELVSAPEPRSSALVAIFLLTCAAALPYLRRKHAFK